MMTSTMPQYNIVVTGEAPLVDGYRVPVDRTLPVDSRGVLGGTGDARLDGEDRFVNERVTVR